MKKCPVCKKTECVNDEVCELRARKFLDLIFFGKERGSAIDKIKKMKINPGGMGLPGGTVPEEDR